MTLARRDDVADCLSTWRERWQRAPTAAARAHAQAALDHWLDQLLELDVGPDDDLSAPHRPVADLADPEDA